ncbi:MAG: hypothetical protein HOV81_01925 [Kofleriaceae bacterium]|nr:hypothetical protein [Kofleriaceae bacterium]
MTNHRLASLRLVLSTLTTVLVFCASAAAGALAMVGIAALATGCASGAEPAAPDAAPEPVALAGHYSLHSRFSVTAPPAVADVLGELDAMTDGADDPSRYLIDRIIAKLPEGRTRTLATSLAPYLAAYVSDKIADVAPNFATGTRALATGLDRIARRFETSEMLDISADGRAVRTVDGLRWGADAVDFSSISPAATSVSRTDLDDLAIATHALTVPYGTMLRLGLEHTVIPLVVPRAQTLSVALSTLADCGKLGAIVSEWVGLGSPEMYERACTTALTAAAAEVYERLDALDAQPFVLELSGTATVVDRDANGSMDGIVGGRWTGAFGSGTFDGALR